MQSDQNSLYTSELDCVQKVISNDGPGGLIFRGETYI